MCEISPGFGGGKVVWQELFKFESGDVGVQPPAPVVAAPSAQEWGLMETGGVLLAQRDSLTCGSVANTCTASVICCPLNWLLWFLRGRSGFNEVRGFHSRILCS